MLPRPPLIIGITALQHIRQGARLRSDRHGPGKLVLAKMAFCKDAAYRLVIVTEWEQFGALAFTWLKAAV